jgi:hypothetical protein
MVTSKVPPGLRTRAHSNTNTGHWLDRRIVGMERDDIRSTEEFSYGRIGTSVQDLVSILVDDDERRVEIEP